MYWTGKVLVDVSTSPVGPPPPLLAPLLAYSLALLKMAKVEFDCPPGLGVCLDPGSTPGNVKTDTRVLLIEPVGQP